MRRLRDSSLRHVMKTGKSKQYLRGIGPILALALLLLISLAFMSVAIREPSRFGGAYVALGIFNAIALVPLVVLIGWNLLRLRHQVQNRVPGAQLTMRMVGMFVLLSVTPVLVVYFFSLTFLYRGIDSWFEVRIEEALKDSLALSRSALDMRKREILKQTRLIATDLSDVSTDLIEHRLEDIRRLSGASELTVIADHGQFFVSSSLDPMSMVPRHPEKNVLFQVRRTGLYISLDPIANEGLHVRVVVSFPDVKLGSEPRLLQALFPFTKRVNELSDSIQEAYTSYGVRASSRQELKGSFMLTLSLVLLLSLLSAVWAAFFSARRAVAPLRDLVNGTQAISQGDYETRLPPSGSGEIAALIKSFNYMIRKLAQARDDTGRSRQQVEGQRRYLEAVLTRLSSGVITLDHAQCVFKVNKAAHQILEVDLDAALGHTLTSLCEIHPHLRPFTQGLSERLDTGEEWRDEINLFGAGGRRVLLCRGTSLTPRITDASSSSTSDSAGPRADTGNREYPDDSNDSLPGHVIVFDDITALIQAQHDAAWGEVARRLAHEIKNPLTPIQLSAERLRHKYLRKMPPDEAKTLDNLTRTIVQQVESMKTMANAFSDYARPPRMKPRLLNINELIRDVLELYRGSGPDIVLETKLDPELPELHADPDRLRQVVHNLIKNALEANRASQESLLIVQTRCVGESSHRHIEVEFQDRGAGFPPQILEQAFAPYITTKPKGTGLGLAIVKKIVEEHGGIVSAANNSDSGASMIMRFPVVSLEYAAPGARDNRDRPSEKTEESESATKTET
uniref:histidine kinase n=1 Tax=Candidatus Kentrum sp. SD TaxID=2126332 RepID=A0A450YTV2_9GAMM|nr:MAG: Signal transduction histidine kinase involved in nitrogen fixation and metabolism regulation [Candidatus Kentron sp. SD]VFK44912.1 MAG: Signal transduction histidine kinase involved in nitrogen fixation and metabolism regulation [Candidatus Kentron sp. SD]VFK78039.1 MAG: Signal transduction histidine kinase involved in nitrogen fixation and metabolism regulation [Candidatus Kentron sp. SD]